MARYSVYFFLGARTKIPTPMSGSIYRSLCAPLLFQLDPEPAHNVALACARMAALPGAAFLLRQVVFKQPSEQLRCAVMGMQFRSPVCIAAGLDKDCVAFDALAATGAGAVELGTVTPEPQPGNPTPRMFRFSERRSLINRLGFPSCGVKEFRARLARVSRGDVKVGVNIGKNKDTPIESCEADYERCASELSELADYIAINVSSPNTPGLRALQTPEMLIKVIGAVQHGNSHRRPIAVKISPDCTPEQVDELVDCCRTAGIAGIIATNTTVTRPPGFESTEAGGLSGQLLAERSRAVVEQICARTKGTSLSVIGAGGIASAAQAESLLNVGCAAVQLYTGLVFEGPGLISEINTALANGSSRSTG